MSPLKRSTYVYVGEVSNNTFYCAFVQIDEFSLVDTTMAKTSLKRGFVDYHCVFHVVSSVCKHRYYSICTWWELRCWSFIGITSEIVVELVAILIFVVNDRLLRILDTIQLVVRTERPRVARCTLEKNKCKLFINSPMVCFNIWHWYMLRGLWLLSLKGVNPPTTDKMRVASISTWVEEGIISSHLGVRLEGGANVLHT